MMKTPYDIPPMKRDAKGKWYSDLSVEDTELLHRLRNNWIRNYNAEIFSECWGNCHCEAWAKAAKKIL
jgi:hypothetical protein